MEHNPEDPEVSHLLARPVDPRDTSWENDHPIFRVIFFDLRPGSVPEPAHGINTEEWEVSGADVHEVIRWAEEHAAGQRTWDLHLLVDVHPVLAGRRGLVWLRGEDPNRTDDPRATTTIWVENPSEP